MFPFSKLLGLLILQGLVQSNGATPSHGPEDFESIIYNLTIIPNLQKSTFDEVLLMRVTAKREVSKIVLSKGNYTVDVDDAVELENENLVLKPREPLTEGKKYVVTMHIKDLKIRDDMTGFYKTQISKSEWIYLTNFYPNHAKKVFPCIDDPSVRSTFILNIDLTSESGYQVFANSERNASVEKVFTFESISNISVHNFAFVILKNFDSRNDYTFPKRVNLYTRSEMANFTIFAYNKFPLVMDSLSLEFRVEYPLEKLDVVAVPDHVPQKNSNLGLVVLPESSLLYDENDVSLVKQFEILKSMTRACANMWLQNIITSTTWDQAWVGESLVKYYEYFGFCTPNCYDQLVNQFVIDVQQKTMLEESLGFGGKNIRVNRAASIFRMLNTVIGSENFTNSIRTYVGSNQNQSTGIEDLIEVFEDHMSLSKWLEYTGYPVLNVNFFTDNKIGLSAKTFSLYSDDPAPNQSWTILFELIDIDSDSYMRSQVTLNENVIIFPDITGKFTIVSREIISGYYRVNYDDGTWDKIVEILNSQFDKFNAIDRAAILDDMFNLARAGYLDYKTLFRGLKYLKKETEFLPLKTAMNGFNYLLQAYESKSDEHYKILLNWIRDIFRPMYLDLQKDQGEDVLLDREIVDFVCSIGDTNCIQNVTTSVEEFIHKDIMISVTGDLRPVVYCNALKYGNSDAYEEYFEKMLDNLKLATFADKKLDILTVLGCYHDFEKLAGFINESMTSFEESGIYKAELVKFIESIYSSSLNKSEQMLLFIKDNYQKLVPYFGGTREIMDMIYEMGRMHHSKTMASVLSDFKNVVEAEELSQLIEETIKKMNKEMEASNLVVQKLAKVLDDPNIIPTTPEPITTSIIISSTTTTSTTETILSTTPAPAPISIGITLLKVISGIIIVVIIALIGHFIFFKYMKGSYNAVRNRNESDDRSIVMYDNTV